jgi:hypothetical protein
MVVLLGYCRAVLPPMVLVLVRATPTAAPLLEPTPLGWALA